MDDWRVSSRLTLNLGLRWEGLPHAYDSQNNTANFYPNLYNPAQGGTIPAERRSEHEPAPDSPPSPALPYRTSRST